MERGQRSYKWIGKLGNKRKKSTQKLKKRRKEARRTRPDTAENTYV